jgi:UDP-glucose 4-epimerase
VLEVIEQVRAVTGHAIPVKMEGRRAGDPAILIASSERARNELGWKPSRNNLRVIIEDAWRWHSNHPKGYNDSL